jgi:transposase
MHKESGSHVSHRELIPVFGTIADFRKDNAAALKKVFKEFVKMCMKLSLYQRELLSIDGSKLRAQNNNANVPFRTPIWHSKMV